MAQLNDLLVLGDTNLQGDVISQGTITAPKFIGVLEGLGSAAYTNSTAYDAAGAAATALSDAKAYADGKFLPLAGGTMTGTINSSGNINLYGSNAYFSLGTASNSSKCYFQTYNAINAGVDNDNLKAGFGFGWNQSLTIDKQGNTNIAGNLSIKGNTAYHTGNLKIGTPSATVTVNSVTNAGSVSTLTSSVANKCLSLTFTTGTNTTYSGVTVANSSHTHTPSVG